MKIDVHNYGMQLTDSGENGYRVEVVSIRENAPPILIRMESEGIIKIISILRGMTLRGQDELIYEETDSLKIAHAFRKAGRTIQHD